MSYFVPYIDGSGIHMPTYEDRLENLLDAYRNIFGVDAELSASVPDYQLLSVFAKALDDVSALVVQAYNSRNPMYATGNALDLLLPQYGLTRRSGETDAEARERIRFSLAGRSACTADAVVAAVRNIQYVWDARVYVNDTDTTSAEGIPAHSLSMVVESGAPDSQVAQAIWDTKAPGIGTWGNATANAYDPEGNAHPVSFTLCDNKMIFIYPFVRVLQGGSQDAIRNAVVPAIVEFVNSRGIGEDLNIPQLYGVAYASDPTIADTYIITDIQVSTLGASSTVRDLVPCGWDEKITTVRNGGVNIRFS